MKALGWGGPFLENTQPNLIILKLSLNLYIDLKIPSMPLCAHLCSVKMFTYNFQLSVDLNASVCLSA